MFRDLGRKIQRDVKHSVEQRLKLSELHSGGRIKVRAIPCNRESEKLYYLFSRNYLIFFSIDFDNRSPQ